MEDSWIMPLDILEHFLGVMFDQDGFTLEEAETILRDDEPSYVEAGKNALRDVLLDPSMTFCEKADRYVEEYFPNEEEAEAFFRDIWRVLQRVLGSAEPFPERTSL